MLNEIEMGFAQIKHRWKIFCELYDSDENVKLLNKSGAHIFSLFQKLVIDDAMMSLCRLCDPVRSCGQSNNSLKYHFEIIKPTATVALITEIEALFITLEGSMENIRDMRNKAISHSDYAVALKIDNLPDVSYDDIERSINLTGMILNKIFGTTGDYMPVTKGTSSSTLLKVLSQQKG